MSEGSLGARLAEVSGGQASTQLRDMQSLDQRRQQLGSVSQHCGRSVFAATALISMEIS